MHVGMHSQGNWQQQVFSAPPSRGERLVARHDQNSDGKLSTAELQGTKIGRRMSVDRFARLDRNDDGMLEASELSRKKARRDDGPSIMERVIVARFADHLAGQPEPQSQPNAEDIAEAVLARLDKDDSDGLNSEEIAGTRLAEKIGSGFFELDGDKNGALDKDELTAFIAKAYLGQAETTEDTEPANADEAADNVGQASGSDDSGAIAAAVQEISDEYIVEAPVSENIAAAVAPEASQAAGPTPSASATYADQVRASFETALEVLKSGADQRSAYDVVRTLYAEVNGIFDEI